MINRYMRMSGRTQSPEATDLSGTVGRKRDCVASPTDSEAGIELCVEAVSTPNNLPRGSSR